MKNFICALIAAFLVSSYGSSLHAQTYIFGRTDFAVGNAPVSIAQGDFNGDGLVDLAITNSTDNTVSVLLGKTGGGFTSQVAYATGPEPIGIAVGDFNGMAFPTSPLPLEIAWPAQPGRYAAPAWSAFCWATATERSSRTLIMR